MSSSLRLRASSLIVIAAAAAAALLGFPRGVEASGCPTSPVAELGGLHWCYKHSVAAGNVHLWTPPGYKADSAVTVVYIHGLDIGGSDTCSKKRPYVDCIWDASDHGIVSQFAASGVNALFVAVEGQILSAKTESLRWSSLNTLLASINDKGKTAAPPAVTVIGHSAGMYTARALANDGRTKHLVSVDWVADSLKGSVSSWYRQGGERKLTLIGGSKNQQALMDEMSAELPCRQAASPSSLSAEDTSARCLYLRTGLGHMRPVFDKKHIPLAIRRSTSVASDPTAPGSPTGGTTGGGVITRTVEDGVIDAPLLEIPIPGVELSSAFRESGTLTIPWLAQYVGGVYTFLLSIAGMVAGVMMVIGGFQYVTSGGDKTRISAGKQRIVNALTGLVLAFSSYVILYTINPNLVSFEGLKITGVETELVSDAVNGENEDNLNFVSQAPPGEPSGGGPSGAAPSPICRNEADCQRYCSKCNSKTCDASVPTVSPGMASPSDVQTIPSDIPGVTGYGRKTSRDTIALLRVVGPMFAKDGFKLAIGSGYRDLHGQLVLACNSWKANDGKQEGGYIATPGASFHGVGYAIDVQLWKDGERVTLSGDSKGQQQEDPAEAKYLAETMLKAGFRRLNNEIWHFEPATAPATKCRCYKIEDCSMPPNVKC